MIRLLLLVGLVFSMLDAIDHETSFENSNFTLSTPLNGTGKRELVNYNRFRISEHLREEDWFITAIGDIENYLGRNYISSSSFQTASKARSDTPFSTQTGTHDYSEGEAYAQLHRLYMGYADEKHRVSIGLQKVSMGVGRIWNPTDLFNPKNPLALEPDEVFGVFSAAYSYAPSELSEITGVVAERADHSFKYAGRIKGYLEVADVALNVVKANDVFMLGYELEGELLATGIELRSEGGWFEDKRLKEHFFQGLIGADYAFENSLIVTGEWLHSSKTFARELSLTTPSGLPNNLMRSHDYMGLALAYEFDALLHGSLSQIRSVDDGSSYLSAFLSYSLDDDMTVRIGSMFYVGESGSEFGDYTPTYYLNLKVTF